MLLKPRGNDVTLSIEDSEGNIVETYALSGEGQGSLYTDEDYAYLFFSGTDKTTKVDIDSLSNIKFSNFVGASLEISTTGSIDGGDVVLDDGDSTEKPGLVLKSGVEGEQRPLITGYDDIDLDFVARDINNIGQIVGDKGQKVVIYNNEEITEINIDQGETYSNLYTFAINDSGEVVGQYYNPDEGAVRGYLYSNGTISSLGALSEESDYSSARDINNKGQIVGISSLENEGSRIRRHAFLSNGGSMIDLTPDNDYTQSGGAYAINNFGQAVVHSDGRTLIYDSGQTTNIGGLPGNNSGLGFAINDLGQVVGSSGNRAFLYSDGQMIDLETSAIPNDINNYGDIAISGGILYKNNNGSYTSKALGLYRALAINDSGQVIGYRRNFDGNRFSNDYRLLNPIFAEPIQEDYINIGNISTVGDSVLLQGGEITLSGEAITTAGGSITFDGETKVSNQLTINSSAIDETTVAGGDITFTDTLDSAGGQSLTLQAGTGDIIFEDSVGGNSPFSDFTVAGAGTLNSKDITVNGNLSLEVIDDIKTEDLSVGGLTTISLGKVGEDIYDSTGNVATGNINASGLEVSNNGNFEAGDIAITDGDIDVISLNQLTAGQLTATNGAISLISGTAGIGVNGAVQGDNGFIALAQQDIVTNEITSSLDAVILKSSQGAVTVNGSVNAFGDVSASAANNVTVGAVTSTDSSVALMSAKGMVALGGAISTMEDITVASAQDLLIENETTSQIGEIGFASTKGSITVTKDIINFSTVEISAKQTVTTKRITTEGGAVILNSEEGTIVAGGRIKTKGGDVFISGLERVKAKNIVSRGGDISVISEQGLVRTGYLRSDGRRNTGGEIYLQAGRRIKVTGLVNIDSTKDGIDNGIDYSIYTGVEDESLVTIAHELNRNVSKRNEFVIGDFSLSGTKGETTLFDLIKKPPTAPSPTPTKPTLIPVIIKIFTEIIDAGAAEAPTVSDVINPITGEVYANEAERELVEKLTEKQKNSLRNIINNDSLPEDERLKRDDLRYGEIEENGCFTLELNRHLGDSPTYPNHGLYATYITGSDGDFLVINDRGTYAFFDGLVKSDGAIVNPYGFEPVNSVAEVKTQHRWLRKALNPSSPYYDSNPLNPRQQREFNRLKLQINIYSRVAQECGFLFFLSFDNIDGGRAGRELFEYRTPLVTERSVKVHFVPPANGLYS